MKVIVEPRFPVRGILAGPISKPMRLNLSPMQIKRCILSDAKVYEEMEGGKKREVTLGELPALARKIMDSLPDTGVHAKVESRYLVEPDAESVADSIAQDIKEYHGIAPSTDIHKAEIPVVDKKDVQTQVPVDPYKGMTKAERRRARREAEQRAAEEAKSEAPITETEEEAPLEEVSAEQVIEEVNSTVEEVEQSVEEAAEEVAAEEEKVEE